MNVSVTFTGTVSQIAELLNSVSGLAIEPVDTTGGTIVADGVTHQPETPLMESAPTPPPACTPEVDANGDVWDERIHSGGKNVLKNGTWRKKKGVGQDEYDAVIAENRTAATPPMPTGDGVPSAAGGVPAASAPTPPPAASAPTPPPAASAPTPPPAASAPTPPPAASAPTPPPAASAPTPPPAASAPTPPPAASAPITFQEFMIKLSNSSQTNPAVQPAIPKLVEELQGEFNTALASIADIQGQPEMINRANEIMHRDGLFV